MAKKSNLVQHAEEELKRAGLFEKDSDYEGMLGKAVLDLVKLFDKQGHSGFSAGLTIKAFSTIARYKLLTPIQKPTESDYSVVNDERTGNKQVLQHRRLSSLFSNNGGKEWHDIDAKRTFTDKFLKRWHPVKFPYNPQR